MMRRDEIVSIGMSRDCTDGVLGGDSLNVAAGSISVSFAGGTRTVNQVVPELTCRG